MPKLGAQLWFASLEGLDEPFHAVEEGRQGRALGDRVRTGGDRAISEDPQHRVDGDVRDGRRVTLEIGAISQESDQIGHPIGEFLDDLELSRIGSRGRCSTEASADVIADASKQ